MDAINSKQKQFFVDGFGKRVAENRRKILLNAGTYIVKTRTCYRMENGIEWKENFGMEYGRGSEWNGMEDLKNRMEDCLP